MMCARLRYTRTGVHGGRRRRRIHQIERTLLLAACSAVLLAVCAWTSRLSTPDTPLMNAEITVARGDTLWGIAQKYGDPERYILARVEGLAKANGLPRDACLREGQTLLVPLSGRSAELPRGATYAKNQGRQ
ncbi:MAG: LysM peptidoglycan-binding domain-containing protein [Armatimonadetes bacterium]|nr:LysM peptidoglycan-binding domain-containing protein [Armatimonadota bacterium]